MSIKANIKNISILFFLLNILVVVIAYVVDNYHILYASTLVIWALCVFVCTSNFNKYIVLFFFLVCIFLFILGKPLASIAINVAFWNRANEEQIMFALTIILLSLSGIYFAIIVSYKRSKQVVYNKTQRPFWIILQQVSYYIFIMAFSLNMFQGFYQVVFFRSHTYLDYYNGTYTTDNLPFIVKIGTQMLIPSLSVCLATKPDIKRGKRVLILYLISTLPMLIMGSRASTMSAVIFYIVYCMLRDKTDEKGYLDGLEYEKRWFKTKKLLWAVLVSPVVMGLLVVYTEIRNGIIIQSKIVEKLTHPISWFLYELGQSFDLLFQYAKIRTIMPAGKFPGYFFGYLYDCFFYNQIVSRLLGIETYNAYTMDWLNASRSIAPYLSYYSLGENAFLAGNNTDSVYIIDCFASFGYIGVFVISFLLAIYLINVEKYMNKNWLISTIAIYSIMYVFILPRSMFMAMFGFIVSPYFWFTVGLIYSISNLKYFRHL